MVSFTFLVAAFAAATGFVAAHSEGQPLIPIDVHLANSRRSLADCAHELNNPERIMRRTEKQNEFVRRHLEANGMSDVNFKSSLSRRQAAHTFTDVQCILAPETTIGPYWVKGELIRPDMRETQRGIQLLMDVQVVDVNTCKVVPHAFVELWHGNSTGIYSGVSAERTLGLTYHRGVQQTDKDGVIQMVTNFPGWYPGRASHIHILTNIGGTVLSNNTYIGGKVNHIGQIFFPENILKQIDTAPVYNTNRAARLTNNGDQIFQQAKSGSRANPEATVEFLGSSLNQGLLAYITVGINANADKSRDVMIAHYLSGPPGSPIPSPKVTSPAVSRTSPPTSPIIPTSPASGACVKQFNQCGGQTYKGSTTCCTGACKFVNNYYSQCP